MGSSPRLSLHSGVSLSPSSSSSSISSIYSKRARARSLPRRGHIKAAIFASFYTSIAQLLGAKTADDSTNGAAKSEDGERSSERRSVDLEGGGADFELSVRSSPASNVSGQGGSRSESPADAPFSRTRSYNEGMRLELRREG